jgi:hypothetical protein
LNISEESSQDPCDDKAVKSKPVYGGRRGHPRNSIAAKDHQRPDTPSTNDINMVRKTIGLSKLGTTAIPPLSVRKQIYLYVRPSPSSSPNPTNFINI